MNYPSVIFTQTEVHIVTLCLVNTHLILDHFKLAAISLSTKDTDIDSISTAPTKASLS